MVILDEKERIRNKLLVKMKLYINSTCDNRIVVNIELTKGSNHRKNIEKILTTKIYWHKNRLIGEWDRTESPEKNPNVYGQLTCNKEAKNTSWRKDKLFNK